MNNYQIAIGIIICMVFVSLITFFGILLTRLYIKKIKEHNQKEVAFQKNLKAAIIETQEQVLNNISRDLHDDAGQQLTVINFQLEHLKLGSQEYTEALDPLSESVGKLSQSIRNISHSLNNQLVVQQDLLKAIASEMERLQNKTGVKINFSIPASTKRKFATNEKIIIYRIFQECLNNSLKHSKAGSISVTVKTSPKFKMVITDDGKGFDTRQETGNTSLGLLTMHSRAESIDYHLSIFSNEGKGTIITLTENKDI